MSKDIYLEKINHDRLSRDPDHTKKAREFYAKLWGKSLSNSVLDYDGGVGHYRGETIISFNTISGCMIRLLQIYKDDFIMPSSQNKRLKIIETENDVPEAIKNKFTRFYDIYHTLANFMPLVKGTVNMNNVKGSKYHDFPDLFFKGLYKHQPESVFYDKINVEYFTKLGSWKDFVEKNYLQDFFINGSDYLEYEPLSPNNVDMPYTKTLLTKMSNEDKDICIKYIEFFLTKAIEIIEKRAERLSMV